MNDRFSGATMLPRLTPLFKSTPSVKARSMASTERQRKVFGFQSTH
jgi:hypothetical protein